ncbi:MAG: Gfo/Idh/MocA family protein, partial [Aggregatilineales bacterium]
KIIMALNVALMGVGNIAPAYIEGCSKFPQWIKVTACTDINMERAEAFAAEYSLTAYTVDDLLASDDIDIVINLTIPAVHAEVSQQIIAAGKHVYGEKPLALNREDGKAVLDAADAAGVHVGCAPDTFLGGGGQTARLLIDEGAIGRPVAATAFMVGHGPEAWHPNPAFFYQNGGGPVFDMAPYYLTALVNLMGSIKRISGSTARALTERVAGHESIKGQKMPVEIDTHASSTIDFTSGAVATMIMSFDVWSHSLPCIEIYGTEGSISVPDPNIFGGEVRVWDVKTGEWRDEALRTRSDIQRGIGVADMARAIIEDRSHLASGALAYHVLDAMQAIYESSAQEKYIHLSSTVDQPVPLETL